jgi:type I restriction enzyme, S subunit
MKPPLSNWRRVTLNEIATFTKKPGGLAYTDYKQIPFVPMEFVPDEGLYFDKFNLVDSDKLKSGTYFESGDVLVAKITPSFENGKQGIIDSLPLPFGLATTEVIPFNEVPNVSDKLYLFYYLLREGERNDLAGKMQGTTGRQRLPKVVLQSLELWLPPLAEQRAITAVLRAVQDAIATRRREAALERERKAALMQHLFTHGTRGEKLKETAVGKIPQSWQVKPLKSCAMVQTGVTKGQRLGNADTITVPYLRVANVQDGYLDLSEIKEIEIRSNELDRYLLREGDVVVTEGGDLDKLGRGFIWHGQIPNCIHQNHIFAIRVNLELLLPEYMGYFVQSQHSKTYFLSVGHKTTNLATVNSSKLKRLPMFVPDLEEQKAIVSVLQACDDKIKALEKEIGLLSELFQALLEQLMSGQLVVQSVAKRNESQ